MTSIQKYQRFFFFSKKAHINNKRNKERMKIFDGGNKKRKCTLKNWIIDLSCNFNLKKEYKKNDTKKNTNRMRLPIKMVDDCDAFIREKKTEEVQNILVHNE